VEVSTIIFSPFPIATWLIGRRGDNLWFDRWNEVNYIQPEWVEIISWNDWGESHYIGPIRNDGVLDVMTKGKAPYNFVANMPHDGWRKHLPFVIDMYVQNLTYFTQESMVYWYRPNPATACSDGSTTGNTASQLEIEFPASQVMQDRIFYSVLLNSDAQVLVSIGGTTQTGTWTQMPDAGIGLYHGSVPFNGQTGVVTVQVIRNGNTIMTSTGHSITTDCSANANLANWNAWVGSAEASTSTVGFPDTLVDKVCVNGTGAYNFAGLCGFACSYGYCPLGACLCRKMGNPKPLPKATGVQGYPAAGLDASYSGLCSFTCNYGYCPKEACATVSSPLTIPTVSDFLPPACIEGTGSGNWGGLCSYACHYGMCPTQLCTCTQQGTLVVAPPVIRDTVGYAEGVENDFGLCEFTCPRGYCPAGACNQKPRGSSGDPVYIDPSIWGPSNPDPIPVFGCDPPCVGVLPPYTLPTPTTITCPPLTATLTESWTIGVTSVTVSTIEFKDITTTLLPVYNVNITVGNVASATFAVTPSVFCTATIVASDKQCSTGSRCAQTYLISTTPTPGITVPAASKTKVSFTSKPTPTPTCTQPGGCGGKLCQGDNCNDCNGSGCSCGGCCSGCGGHGGGGGGGIGFPGLPKVCIGLACPPDARPPTKGSGGDGDPDEDCTSTTTVTDTTVYCTISASPGSTTMDTTCTTTQYNTASGCSMTGIETTKYSSEGCPTLSAYVGPQTNKNGFLPVPGPTNPLGYMLNSGTFTWSTMGASPTSTVPQATPTSTDGQPARWELQVWDLYMYGSESSLWFYFGYDGGSRTSCDGDPTWQQGSTDALYRGVPDELDGMIVYGKSCKFSKSGMKLRCPGWADATCTDTTQVVGGTCAKTDLTLQTHYGIIMCSWS
jgi:hypothetical protein